MEDNMQEVIELGIENYKERIDEIIDKIENRGIEFLLSKETRIVELEYAIKRALDNITAHNEEEDVVLFELRQVLENGIHDENSE